MTRQSETEPSMQVRTVVIEKIHLVGLLSRDGLKKEPELRGELSARAAEIANRTGEDEYLVIIPGGLLAAVPVTSIADVPDGMMGYTLMGDEYVSFSFEAGQAAAFWDFFGKPENLARYHLDTEKPRFEIMREALQLSGRTEVYFPLKERDVKVVVLPELKLIGIRVAAADAAGYAEQIPPAFERLRARREEIAGRVEPEKLYGAFYVSSETEQEEGYWACAEVEDILSVPEGMEAVKVPPQSYAVTDHRGQISQIFQTYEQLHKWIADKGYERVLHAWHLEQYEAAGRGAVIVHLHDTITVD
ncbi:effector binding domain-containing protein [Paenibacillus sepulcri]|uniref:GyrI-like domain-containing protein n=1 Tax=Paenibacillus sepulcri TaxID=359917 RepID=A0ABS7C961_9BACL|nr:GyrI-like domain-containing protein [Paenibacillus sepulcri]